MYAQSLTASSTGASSACLMAAVSGALLDLSPPVLVVRSRRIERPAGSQRRDV
jgi:hypothetical protein